MPHVLTGRTEQERRAERRSILERQAREEAEQQRRIREAMVWAERHRVVLEDVFAAVRVLRDRVGRPLTLAEIADQFPKPRSNP